MPAPQQTIAAHLALFLGEQRLVDLPDADLLERFLAHNEAAFAVLVRRHGPFVLGLCRRLLGQEQDAEDAFQATFLVLARRAGALRKRQSLGAWLHGVAYRIASKARTSAARRRRHEQSAGLARPDHQVEGGQSGPLAILDEELARLPERLRAPLMLCYLDGLTREEAAQRLSLLPRTLKARLARGRALLRQVLQRRGVAESTVAGLLVPPASASLPGALAGSAVRHAALFATQPAGVGQIPASVLALAESALRGALLPRLGAVVLVLLALGGLALGVGLSPPPRVNIHKAAPPATSVEAPPPTVDRHGDPLPEGALARLGTVRLRQGGPIDHLALSPDGNRLATGGIDGVVRLWDTRTGKSVRQFPVRFVIYAVALSPDARQVACATGLGRVHLFEVATGKETRQWPPAKGNGGRVCVSLAFSPDGKLLAGASDANTCVWQLSDGQQFHTFPAGSSVFRSVSFSADAKLLGTGGDGKRPTVWELGTGKRRIAIADRKSDVRCAALSPDGKLLAAGYADGLVYLWDTATGLANRILSRHRAHGSVAGLAFTADGKTLFSTGQSDRSVRQWEVNTGKEVGTVPIEAHDGMSVAVSADGKVLAVGGTNCTARIWHARRSWEELVLAEAHQSQVHQLAFSPDGKTLASLGWHGPARLWNVPSAKLIATRGTSADWAYALAFSPDGRSLVLSGRDGKVYWCHPRTGVVQRALRWKKASYPVAIGFLDGKALVAGYSQRDLHLKEMHQVERERPLQGDGHFVSQIAFAPNGRLLASSSSGDGTVLLWDTSTGRQTRKIRAKVAWALALSHDGKYLAAGEDALVRIWDLTTGKEQAQISDHPHRIVSLAFSHDGRWLATSCADCTIRLWETASGKQAGHFRGHTGPAKGLAFSPDGQILASGSDDTSIVLWDVSDRFAKERPRPLPQERLSALWGELGEGAEKGRHAIWALARAPKQSVPFLRERLAKKKVDRKHIDKLIADLDDDEFEVRMKATKDLQSLGEVAGPAMAEALKKTKSLEMKLRLRQALALLDRSKLEQNRLRRLRALAALEYAGTIEARRALEALRKE